MCNFKIIGVRYFNEGFKAEYLNEVINMNSARDTEGHGTFVASIVAGNYVNDVSFFGYAKETAKGVAPRARLAIYKVYWGEKACFSDITTGIDKAISDGVDVICTSLGADDMPLENNAIAIASFSAMKKGVLVATSAGNQGPVFGTVHNAFPWVLTVTAGSIDRWFVGNLTLGNGLTFHGWTMLPSNASFLNLPLVYNFTLSACNHILLNTMIDGIIICDEIGSISAQISYVTSSNVTGAILIADNPKLIAVGGVPCPCPVIHSRDAPFVLDYAKAGNTPLASMTFQDTIKGIKPAPVVASYASRGPSPCISSILKPDIMAPGSLVLGAWTPKIATARIRSDSLYSDYHIWYGTSVACPHVAGVIALLKGMPLIGVLLLLSLLL